MKTTIRAHLLAALAATFTLGVTGPARAEGQTVVLNTFSKVWVAGDALGPLKSDGTPKVGQNTGCGIMDANIGWDQTSGAKPKLAQEVVVGAVYTRSDSLPNDSNSYLQGGFALGKITSSGAQLGAAVDLPRLSGDRAFMRPLLAFTPKYAALVAASEDNNSHNGNPKPVLYIVDKTTGKLAHIANNTREDDSKPTDLIEQALRDGINVDDPGGQRGPHMIVPIDDRSFLVGIQYNNHAQEAFRVTVLDDGTVKMSWLERYTDHAQHTRPQVAYAQGAKEAFLTGVEADGQPADIGVRLTKLDIGTGKAIVSEIIIRSDPEHNKYVAEPSIALLGNGKVAIGYTMGVPARSHGQGNGHAGGSPVSMLDLYNTSTLAKIGETRIGVAQFSRHPHIFATAYGPKAEMSVAVISGSSTGTGKGFEQLIPLKSDGTLGLIDTAKVYVVGQYADVANLQARGKRNPNDQAKGFINGTGVVPNPGYTPAGNPAMRFMPEVSHFSVSVLTGYSSPTAAGVGRRESLWLSLVPASWNEGLSTVPGIPTDKPGSNADGTGPMPRTTGPGTDPSGGAGSKDGAPGAPDGNTRWSAGEAGGCAVAMSTDGSRSGPGFFLALVLAGACAVARRRSASATKESA